MSAMNEMLANMIMKALPEGSFEKIVEAVQEVATFKEQLNRIENSLKELQNDNGRNSAGNGDALSLLRIGTGSD